MDKNILIILLIGILTSVIWLQFMNYPGAFKSNLDDIIYWAAGILFTPLSILFYLITKSKDNKRRVNA